MKLFYLLLLFSISLEAKQFDLEDVAFDRTRDNSQRWRALLALSVQGDDQSIEHLNSAVRSSEWFMRDAALVAMGAVDKKLSLRWAKRLVIRDPSMLVRTTAVKIIRENGSKEDIPVLLKAVYSKQNFRGGRSLWIRRHIAEAIFHLDRSSYKEMLRFLDDSDVKVNRVALNALESVTGHTPDYDHLNIQSKISTWKDILISKAD